MPTPRCKGGWKQCHCWIHIQVSLAKGRKALGKVFSPSLTEYLWKEFKQICPLLVYLMNNITDKVQGNQNQGESEETSRKKQWLPVPVALRSSPNSRTLLISVLKERGSLDQAPPLTGHPSCWFTGKVLQRMFWPDEQHVLSCLCETAGGNVDFATSHIRDVPRSNQNQNQTQPHWRLCFHFRVLLSVLVTS